MTKSKSSKASDTEEIIDMQSVESDDDSTNDAEAEVVDTGTQDAEEGQDEKVLDDLAEVPPEEVPDSSVDEVPDQALPDAPAPQRDVVVQKTGFFQTLIAGVLAAGAGFLGAQYSSQSWPFEPGPTTDPLAIAQSAQDGVAELQARVSATEEMIAAEPQEPIDLSGLEAQIGTLGDALSDVQARLEALEARPVTGNAPQADLSGVEGEIAGLQDQVAALIAEANIAEASAAAAAQDQLARAALSRVMANLQNGTPFADALSELQNTVDTDIPDILSSQAASGIATLGDLQDSFDPAARDALAAARSAASNDGAGMGDRLGAFLRARTGARSVEPREGDDPDAVLSRVGGSVASGNLGDALAEAAALPEEARSAMTDWLAQAQTRYEALAAADALSQELTSN